METKTENQINLWTESRNSYQKALQVFCSKNGEEILSKNLEDQIMLLDLDESTKGIIAKVKEAYQNAGTAQKAGLVSALKN